MVRLAISVEGLTEERFVKRLLVPHFSSRGIYVIPIDIQGNVSIDRVNHELQNLAYSFDYVTMLYDFYGFKRKAEDETKQSLEQKISQSVSDQARLKVIPYVQMYEFEGLLFSSPEALNAALEGDDVLAWSRQILSTFSGNPESINDSPNTAPSKRLEQNTDYRKTTHGPDIAEDIGLVELRNRCLGFDAWLSQLENLEEHT